MAGVVFSFKGLWRRDLDEWPARGQPKKKEAGKSRPLRLDSLCPTESKDSVRDTGDGCRGGFDCKANAYSALTSVSTGTTLIAALGDGTVSVNR